MRESRLPAFDDLVHLAQRDPEALEQLRREQVESVIAGAPPQLQRRLRGLQFQIDSQIQIHTSSLGSCIKISQMMHDSLARLRYLLNQLTEESKPSFAVVKNPSPASVIPFRRKPDAD